MLHLICCGSLVPIFGLGLSDTASRPWWDFEGRVPDHHPARVGSGPRPALFELMLSHDLEGIVAKRLSDPYEAGTKWLKIKNPDYSQKEGRGDLFYKRRELTK
jgi:hypothetical protein